MDIQFLSRVLSVLTVLRVILNYSTNYQMWIVRHGSGIAYFQELAGLLKELSALICVWGSKLTDLPVGKDSGHGGCYLIEKTVCLG